MRFILSLLPFLLALVAAQPTLSQEERIVLPGGAELFKLQPDKAGPWPVILFLHGHQSPPRPGGRVFLKLDQRPRLATIDEGRLAKMRDRGYLAASVSLPGYGTTPGPADFWGPRSQAVLQEALDYLLAQPNVDQDRVGVYGVSGGAATASMQATRDSRIAAMILVAGIYDLGDAYPSGDPDWMSIFGGRPARRRRLSPHEPPYAMPTRSAPIPLSCTGKRMNAAVWFTRRAVWPTGSASTARLCGSGSMRTLPIASRWRCNGRRSMPS